MNAKEALPGLDSTPMSLQAGSSAVENVCGKDLVQGPKVVKIIVALAMCPLSPAACQRGRLGAEAGARFCCAGRRGHDLASGNRGDEETS
jgi:hypothetical protein